LESRLDRYKDVLPLCEQIVHLQIGIGELIAFHTAVCEKAEMLNLSLESAAYRVIEDIRDYNKLGGMKKQQSYIATQIYLLNQFSGRQNNALMALFKLQIQGVTEEQILNACRFLGNGHNMASTNIQ
jgi:hypothetical protein